MKRASLVGCVILDVSSVGLKDGWMGILPLIDLRKVSARRSWVRIRMRIRAIYIRIKIISGSQRSRNGINENDSKV